MGQTQGLCAKGGSLGALGTKHVGVACPCGIAQGDQNLLITSSLSDNHIYTYLKIAKSEVTLQKTVLEKPERIIKIGEIGYKKSNGRKESSRKVEIYEDFL